MQLSVLHLSKHFAARVVFSRLSCTFAHGGIHALTGPNGAGKSTLAAILSGALQPTSGLIAVNDRAALLSNTRDAMRQGIICVPQHPPLADWLTAEQNITLSPINKQSNIDECQRLLSVWCHDLPLRAKASCLTPAQRFFTALLRVLLMKPQFLILDEPTALLSNEEIPFLYCNIRSLTKSGMTALVITHHSDELKYCDTVTTLTAPSKSAVLCEPYNEQCLPLSTIFASSSIEVVRGITAAPRLVTLVRGSETALHSLENEVLSSVSKWRRHGAAIIPTDRIYRASYPSLNVAAMLCALRPGTVDADYALRLIKRAGVNTVPNAICGSLSGGMLQRLIMARELDGMPHIVLAFNPLQGLDIESQQNAIASLRRAARTGSAVLVASSALFPPEAADRVIRYQEEL